MQAGDGLRIAAQRIRDRFPSAVIVILRLGAPARIRKKFYGSQIFNKWAGANGFGKDFIRKEEFRKPLSSKNLHDR